MNNWLQISLIATTVAIPCGSAYGKTGRELGPEPTIYVHFYNQAPAQANTLKWAAVEVTRIFKAAGVKIVWQQPATDSPEAHRIDMSTSPALGVSDNRHYLVVRIIPHAPVTGFTGALGFALPFAQAGSHVSIFYDRIESLARTGNAASYVILGHAMAHEIGHVLLRSAEHSNVGLMQGRWDRATLRLASSGLLAFLPQQAEQLRKAAAIQGSTEFETARNPAGQALLSRWDLPRLCAGAPCYR
jgi:hypothetical protein